jgi:16S rRNA (adenine1518-N6/adenine1519-N6)-dimethyltransferase
VNDQPRAKKRFGQHFLVDQGIIEAIVRHFAPRRGERLVEIGPGAGAITGALLERGVRLIAVEIDRDMQALLIERFAPNPDFTLVPGDILSTPIDLLTAGESIRVIGNLPYNIATQILFHLLGDVRHIEEMYFMVQREVAERLAAPPGSRTYGRPSVMLQRLCRIETDMSIPPQAFRPPPKVVSAMLRLRPRAQPLGGEVDEALFHNIVRAAFVMRRKTLRNALRQWVSPAAFEQAGIDPVRRAETLSVEDFARLTREAAA